MRALLRYLVLFPMLAVVACANGSATAPGGGPVTQNSATIQPSGGSVSVENEDGVSLSVRFPPGAVLSPTRITLGAIDPPSGVNARFVIEPAGLDLNAPATFTVKIPAGVTIRESFGLSFTNGERVFVPTTVDLGARTVTATLYHLGFTDPGTTLRAATGVATALDSGSFIDVDAMECDIIREALTNQILRAQAFSGPFPPDLASPLIQEYRAALLVCTSPDSVAEASAILREYACTNVASATIDADVTDVLSVEDLRRNLGFLIAAEGMAQEFGADCHIQSVTMENEFSQFLDSYVDRINAPGFTRGFPTWNALWRENLVVVGLSALAQEYAVPEAVERINNEVFPALFARLHEVASAACNEDENNSFLLDIITGGFALNHPIIVAREVPSFSGLSTDDVIDETQRCGSSLFVEARASDNLVLDSATVLLSNQSGSVRVTDNGKVVLSDNLLGFTCNGIVDRPPIHLRAEIPGSVPVVSLGNLSGTTTVNIAATLAALPAPEAGELPSSFEIVLERDRSVCGIDAPGTIELVRVVVNTTGFLGTMSGLWSGSCPGGGVNGTFTVEIDSDGTVTGGFNGSASGGIQGTVSSNGTFDATANGTAGACTWSGSLNLAGGIVNGSGSWHCSDAGCSGEYHSAPLPPTVRR